MSYNPTIPAGLSAYLMGGAGKVASQVAPQGLNAGIFNAANNPPSLSSYLNPAASSVASHVALQQPVSPGIHQYLSPAAAQVTNQVGTSPAQHVQSWQGSNPTSVQASAFQNPIGPNPGAAAPHPNEPPHPAELGQWGGGGWATGSGAPASAQPMWLGSYNNGTTWSQQPGQGKTAPQAGTTNSGWGMAKNQDPDSPTWVQQGR